MSILASDERIFQPKHVLGWTLFTLSAGFINASAVMACKSFVTHMTGNVTNLAVDTSRTTEYAFVIASFIGGAMVAVLVSETMRAKPKAAFALPLLASFVTLVVLAVLGRAGWFGAFGVDGDEGNRGFVMLGVLSAVMGMVNAAVATATQNQIRVTHVTGPATDLAANFVRAALGAGKGHFGELRWAALRVAKLATFAGGAAIAVKFADRLQYDLFAVAGGILIVALGFTGAPDGDVPASADGDDEEPSADERGARPLRFEDGMPMLPETERPRPSTSEAE
jgi:uncharacterized membrane protein YoaK (UPF0700 family)